MAGATVVVVSRWRCDDGGCGSATVVAAEDGEQGRLGVSGVEGGAHKKADWGGLVMPRRTKM
ncbi:hypothetical protein ES319_D05G323900v1 [Gossypium barbadense]|uniref:Uncharacterized protein n=1 Tax=Gossypium barbadense TaxID=3634 RepID=A0A5J5RKD6_GOSBA|nr:hypothetical protein ES319_D05G323900v1 [Gossypium barbadense]